VGTDKDTYEVHESVLSGSEFFRAALKGEWTEAQEGKVSLQNVKPAIFEVYMQWLYQRRLPEDGQEERECVFMGLFEAYVLGDQFRDASFKDVVIDSIIALPIFARVFLKSSTVRFVYDHSTEHSASRRLVVDLYTRYGYENASWLPETDRAMFPVEFLFDLAKNLFRERKRPNRKIPHPECSSCLYHCHGLFEDGACYKKPNDLAQWWKSSSVSVFPAYRVAESQFIEDENGARKFWQLIQWDVQEERQRVKLSMERDTSCLSHGNGKSSSTI